MSGRLRVLLVEDVATDAKLVLHALRALGREIHHQRVEDEVAMAAALASETWDLVLSDWSMPRFSALGALATLKKSGIDIPFVIVSGTIGEETAVDAMRAGAQDYVLKDRLDRLVPAVERELRESQDRMLRRRAEASLRASEARFRRLWDSGVILVTICDLAGKVLDINDAGAKMIGYTRSELVDNDVQWRHLTPPEWRPADEAAGAQLQADGIATAWERELFRKDGSRVAFLSSAALLDDGTVLGVAVDLTARKLAEAAARAEQARFRALVEHSADGITLNHADASFAYVSPAAARILGRAAGTLTGTKLLDYIDPEERVALAEVTRRVRLTPGAQETTVHRFVRPDGSRRWVETTRTNHLDDPAVAGIVCNLRDITDRKQAEDALAIAEHRFSALFDSGIIGIIVAEASGRIHDANDSFLDMMGYTRGELESGMLDWRKSTPPEWAVWNQQTSADVLELGRSNPREKEYFRKDGTRVPVLVGVAKVEGPYLVSVSIDLTERKRTDAALLERMQIATLGGAVGIALTAGRTLRETLQSAADAVIEHLGAALARIWTFDAAKNELVLEASAGLSTDVEGADGKIHMGEGEIGLIAQERRGHVTNAAVRDLRGPDAAWAEREGVTAFAGHPLIVSGQLVGVLAIFSTRPLTDVTHSGLASIARAIAAGVDRHLVERAKTHLEAQLRQAQKMEAVGRLAGGVAHDFNNMLSVILSYAELLLGDLRPGDPMRADLEEISRAGRAAADLTRQLLMFSRQQVIEPKVVDLTKVLGSMDKMLRRMVGEDVDLVTSTKTAIGRVRVDPSSIEQVVMNLVVNARDAMPTGGKLTIETADVMLDEEYAKAHVTSRPGPHVMLAVTDNGIGMDKATQAHIFEPFYTTKETGKGTGLGLSTVFGIVAQSGGSVWVYSELGKGTTFKIYLPRVDAEAQTIQAPPGPSTLRGTETVLLVEDEEQVRVVVRGILGRHGYHVLEARNAGEALLLCESHPATIHMLLSDVVMPQMSGPELAKRLSIERPEMRVLCMSGYTDDSIVRHGVLEAHFAFLQKPITPETLTRKVREVLDAPLTQFRMD